MHWLWSLVTAATAVAATPVDGRTCSKRTPSGPRYVLYMDQYHTTAYPNKTMTAGINYVITAFANSSLFTTTPAGTYTPFMDLAKVRAMFDQGTKVCMAIGGWGDNAGFDQALRNASTTKLFAKNVAATLDRLGYDCVDIDLEYAGGNGADYKQVVNSQKAYEIETFPQLLKDVKEAIGSKELSMAVPGLQRDMIAFTAKQVPKMNKVVDFVTVMTYDLMNRRDTVTTHHTDVVGSLQAIDRYLQLGFDARKLNLGFAFYAKFFTTAPGVTCTQGVGCPTVLLEAADGSDTGKSGALTFEAPNFAAVPKNLTLTPDQSCGPGTFYKCGGTDCCSQYGFCGSTPAHCGTGCNAGFGRCEGVSTIESFKTAMQKGQTDQVRGGQWFWDAAASLFWTWDTPELVQRKFSQIMQARGLGGVAAWSLAEDSFDWSHLAALQKGVRGLNKGSY